MRNKFTWRSLSDPKRFFVIGLIVLGFLSFHLVRSQMKDRALNGEIMRLQSEADALGREGDERRQLLAILGTPKFFEQEARKSLGYAKPDEQVVVIEKNGECRMKNEECTGTEAVKEMSNPRKWWMYFFGSS